MTTYRWHHQDLENTITVTSRLIRNTLYHCNRQYGLIGRLHAGIDDCARALDAAMAHKLKNDARALRTLARQLDIAGKKLNQKLGAN